MDLLGDIGTEHQLISARSENKILQEKVKQLSEKVSQLTLENECLKAEVEIYRNEAAAVAPTAASSSSATTTTATTTTTTTTTISDDFVRSGDGSYPCRIDTTLYKLHGPANLLCCALSADDRILATGGADNYLTLVPSPGATPTTIQNAVQNEILHHACKVRCEAPVICLAFASASQPQGIIALGCMDGTVSIIHYQHSAFLQQQQQQHDNLVTKVQAAKHAKYVKAIAWSTKQPNVFASASADGTVNIYKYKLIDTQYENEDHPTYTTTTNKNLKLVLDPMDTLHLQGPVEAICFVEDTICCYARGTPFLSCFDLSTTQLVQTKIHLNQSTETSPTIAIATTTTTTTGALVNNQTPLFFDDHVSFSVMDIKPSPRLLVPEAKHYLALATDASRNIIVDFHTGKIIRNLYGHQNDSYSQPKLAWSCNGQYLLGNTQHESLIYVWDIASCKIVQKLGGGGGGDDDEKGGNEEATSANGQPPTPQQHTQPIRDMYCSPLTNTMVTTSFDKQTKLWSLPTAGTQQKKDGDEE